jgi:glutamyl-tRNA synthetase
VKAAVERTGRPAGIRFMAPNAMFEFLDGCAGLQRGNPADDVGDFLIVRRDGTPAYQLAVVVDDAAQSVSEVVRGNDLLSSTPRQLALIAALGLPKPSYWHVPLVTDATGQRLAKRAHALGLETLRARGADPRKIVAWVANSCGLDVGPSASASEVVRVFDITKLSASNVAIDDAETLRWLSG